MLKLSIGGLAIRIEVFNRIGAPVSNSYNLVMLSPLLSLGGSKKTKTNVTRTKNNTVKCPLIFMKLCVDVAA